MAGNADTTTDSGKTDEHDKENATCTSTPAELISLVARMLPLADVHNNVLRALIDCAKDDRADFVMGYLAGNTGVLEEIVILSSSLDPTNNDAGLAWLDMWMAINEELVDEYSEVVEPTPLYVKEGAANASDGRDVIRRFIPKAVFCNPAVPVEMGDEDLLDDTLALGTLDVNASYVFQGDISATLVSGAMLCGERDCLKFLLNRDDIDLGVPARPGGCPVVFDALVFFMREKKESPRGLQYDADFLSSLVGHPSVDVDSLVNSAGITLLQQVVTGYVDETTVPMKRCAQAMHILMSNGADGRSGVPFTPLQIALLKAKSGDPHIAVRSKVAWAVLSGHLFLDYRSPLWGFVLNWSILLQCLHLGLLVWPFLLGVGAFLRFLRLPLRFFA